MVDVKLVSRARNFVPLALLRQIADGPSQSPPTCLDYIGDAGVKAIKGSQTAGSHLTTANTSTDMPLVKRGRLSVQKVPEQAWNTIQLLADRGGWDELLVRKKKTTSSKKSKSARKKHKSKDEDEEHDDTSGDTDLEVGASQSTTVMNNSHSQVSGRKRKAEDLGTVDSLLDDGSSSSLRRSSRMRRSIVGGI